MPEINFGANSVLSEGGNCASCMSGGAKKTKKPRKLTAYNKFIKQRLDILNKSSKDYKANFLQATKEWASSPENPKNKVGGCGDKVMGGKKSGAKKAKKTPKKK